MREILKKGDMLTDEHIHLAQEMLHTQFPHLDGFQSSLLSQVDGFSPVRNESIQIHHVDGNHWVVSTSIGQTVSVFDSKFDGRELSSSLSHQLATIYRTLMKTTDEDGEEIDPILEVSIPYVQQQQGKRDCGLFAVAFALHAALGNDLQNIVFDQMRMRSHLLACFEKKKLTSFPNEKRKAREEKYLYFPMQEIELYCTCLMPETYGDMVQCDACEKWYHLRCVGLLEPPQVDWICMSCM